MARSTQTVGVVARSTQTVGVVGRSTQTVGVITRSAQTVVGATRGQTFWGCSIFVYSVAPAVEAGTDPYSALITWETSRLANTEIRWKEEDAGSWTTPAAVDSDIEVVSHSWLLEGLSGGANYEAEIRSTNSFGYTPGWENTLSWGIDLDGTFLPDGYVGVPTIETGPEDTSTLDGAIITCTTDIDAYMQVRTKQINPLGEWVEHSWTVTPLTSPSKTVAGLDSEHEGYYYDIRVSANADGSNPSDWTPGDNTAYFFTLCSGTVVYSNHAVSKETFGKLEYLEFTWDTDKSMNDAETRWRATGGSWGSWLDGWVSGGTSSTVNDMDFKFDEGTYEYQVRNENKCLMTLDASDTLYFYVDAGGEPHYGIE